MPHGWTVSTTATISHRIRKRIDQHRPGWVFTPFDFIDLGSPSAIGMTLQRLRQEGSIRRIARGIYELPKSHPRLGKLAPTPDAVAEALARRSGAHFQPSGGAAANILRLSEQVPAQHMYETDGRGRTLHIGNQTITLRKAATKKLTAAPTSNLVFAALRSIGRQNTTKRRVSHLRSTLSPRDRRQLLKDLPRAPVWMHELLRYIAIDSGDER